VGGFWFSPHRFWPGAVLQGGIRSRSEIDAWQGYDSNTSNPPDANLRQIRGSNMAANRWIAGGGSYDEREAMGGEQLQARDPLHFLMFINIAGGG